ncbi:hypothetical protein ACFVDH_40305, partial [Streptomyces sp. NPDC057674]
MAADTSDADTDIDADADADAMAHSALLIRARELWETLADAPVSFTSTSEPTGPAGATEASGATGPTGPTVVVSPTSALCPPSWA